MNCRAVQDKLSLAIEGELPADELLVVRAHLAECDACGAAYRDMTRLVEDLRSLPVPKPPAALRPRIRVALDAVDAAEAAERTRRQSPWELVGPYLAAAAVIAVAFTLATLLSRPHFGRQVARAPARMSRPVESPKGDEAVPTVAAPGPQGAVPAPGGGPPDKRTDEAVAEASRRIRELQEKEALKSRDGELLWPPDLEPGRPGAAGTPSAGLMAPAAPTGTRSGTFSTPTDVGPIISMPRGPTAIDVSFRPPDDPVVGQTVFGVVELSARESLPKVDVTATGDAGLTIDKAGGALYSGPLRAGETTRVPVPMTASKTGLHEIEIKVASDAPGGSTDLKAFVPNFHGEAEPPRAAASPADKSVNLVFKNAPVRQALLDIARQAGLRIEMAEGLGSERITQDVRGVPARAALRAVAEEGGYELEEAGGVFKVTRATSTNGN
jgi:hypothetical protein